MHTKKAPWPAGSLLATGAEALWTQGDLTASRGWFDAAWIVAEHRDDAPAMAAAALGLAGLWVHERFVIPSDAPPDVAATGARLRGALAAVPSEGVLALRLRARLAAEADYASGGSARILACLDEARVQADPLAIAEALTLAHHCLLGPEHAATRRRLAEELIAESSRTGRRGDLLIGLLLRGVDLLLDADPHARRCLNELRGMLDVQDHLAVRSVLRAVDVMTLMRTGQLAEAETAARQCADDGEVAGNLDAGGRLAAQVTAIRWFQGRIGEMAARDRPAAAGIDPSLSGPSSAAVRAVAEATLGHRREALGAMAAFRDGLAAIPSSGSRLLSWYALVEAAWLLDRRDVAAEAHALLLPHRHLPMMAGFGAACFGSVEHALGVARLTLGDHDGAVEHLRRAVRDNEALGHWPAATLAGHRLAFALAHSSDPELRALATPQAEAAVRDAAEFGMTLPPLPNAAPSASSALAARSAQPGSFALPAELASPSRSASFAASSAAPADTENSAIPAVPNPPRHHPVTCRRNGKAWQVTGLGRTLTIDHSRGMAYLAVLLANPGRDITAVELTGGPPPTAAPDRTTPDATDNLSLAPTSQPILDDQAVRRYRARIAALDQDVAAAESEGDHPKAAEARAEQQWLRAELRSATGLTGRPRVFSTGDERARIAVGKAIRRALARITDADREVGSLLAGAVHTGRSCSYRPPTEP